VAPAMSESDAPAALNVYVCSKFSGREGARVVAMIVARDATRALELLNEQLRNEQLPDDAKVDDCLLFPIHGETALILANGSY